jgi:cyclopropane fatty-acyl-phospholipid synthase-like methyltransferase
MSKEILSQRDYWNREAAAFEQIYSHRKPWLWNLLDRVFRKDMFERFAFALRHCEPIAGRTFLDVGCGSGLYSIELARRGAAKVVGIDVAERMLDLCRQSARREGLADRCSFEHADLLAYTPQSPFDVTIGIGLFDYIRDPLPVLRKMREVTKDKAILSFPRLWTWRAPVRKVRLLLRGCGVYFYSAKTMRELIEQAGFRSCRITKVGKLHCVVALSKSP